MIARIHELFGDALDQPESQRLGWLRTACAGDEALYAAVLRLLQADAAASLLDGDVAALAEPLVQAGAPQAPFDDSRHVGTRFGPYQVTGLLGRGGMGSVWLAQREDGEFRHQVAIKLLAGALPSNEALQRFAQERQILARLQHPNIARVIDGGSIDGVPWFAMDFVQGVALDAYANAHDLSLERRLALFVKVVAAVQFAHQNLVVHRDLKPSNILVDASGEPKLLDFGVAKLLDAGSELTASRAPLSMAYAAPEQLLGNPITTATDLYSLGVILYELLTGTRPHKPRGNGSLALLQAITDTDPPPPSRALGGSTTRQSRQLQGDLDTIILTCLNRDPARRYASAQALVDDIEAYLKQQPIRARPESWRYRSGKFVRRNRLAVSVAALALVAVLALSIYSLLKAREAEQQRQLATAQAQRATAVQDFLISLFDQQRPDATLGASISAKDLLDRAERQLQAGGGTLQGETRAALLLTLAQLRYDLGDYDAALALNEQVVLQAGQEFGEASVPYALARIARSGPLQELGQADAAVADCDAALPVLRSALATAADTVNALLECAAVLRWDDRLDDAARLLDEAVSRSLDVQPPERELARKLLRQQGMLALDRGNHPEATALFTRLIDALRADPTSPPSGLATALHSRATSEQPQGHTRAAIADYREALALHQRVLGPGHDLTVDTQSTLAVLLHEVGENEEAQRLGEDALEQARKAMGSDSPSLALIVNQAAIHAFRRQDLSRAAALLEEAIAINTRAHGQQHANTLALLNNLSAIQRMLGRYDAARASANEALRRLAGSSERGYNERQAHARLAFIAGAQGNAAEQAREARWILATLEQVPLTNAEEPYEALSELAIAQQRLGQADAALASIQRQEAAIRSHLEAGSELFSKYLARVAWVALEAGQAERALGLSGEVLGALAPADLDWKRSTIRLAAIVRLRALHQLGRGDETGVLAEVLRVQRASAPADEALYWRTLQDLLPTAALGDTPTRE